MGYVDIKGDWAIRPQYKQALPFSDGLAVVSDGARSSAIDRAGKVVVPWFDGLMYPFSQGLACVVPNGSIRLGSAGRLREKLSGRAGDDPYAAPWWELRGKVGFVDTAGRIAIQPRFQPKLNFLTAGCGFSAAGYAVMRQDGREGLINTQGEWVVEPQYDYVGMVFSGNRKVVALVAERTVKAGFFLDTIERLDGSMVPGEAARWREAGMTQEAMVNGGLGRTLLNRVLFPRWQQDLLNDDVSARTLTAWAGSLLSGGAVALAIFLRAIRNRTVAYWIVRTAVALIGGLFATAVSFLAGVVTPYATACLLLLMIVVGFRAWRRRQTGRSAVPAV